MEQESAPGVTRRSPSPVVQQLISMFAAAVLMTAIAVVAVVVSGGLPPRLGLTATTWQWTGSSAGRDAVPLEVADPAAYTIRFTRELTFEATADCNQMSGTYSSIAAGRAGGSMNSLTLEPGPTTLAACGPESLSAEFVTQLGSATRYEIAGSQLTITLDAPSTMTFRAVDPLLEPSQNPS